MTSPVSARRAEIPAELGTRCALLLVPGVLALTVPLSRATHLRLEEGRRALLRHAGAR